ncbi:MAG: helix-turn-helix transcriptional regulator [Polyangiaceae bacterium]|nr:helix-turn-helix transcriptional regulator [Polyangiaceae bacterium]MCW5790544.1 helix-turn-helix transcriptional regulator [Polyangiaceae bacterium]
MGITERRERERARRRREILDNAWKVASEVGWSAFSVEKVAASAELARGTIYTYFPDLATLVLELGKEALSELSVSLGSAESLGAALDVPVRFAQRSTAAFNLLFPRQEADPPQLMSEGLAEVRRQAAELMGALQRLSSGVETQHLPADEREAAVFLSGIGMAGALIPELRASTSLRHRWQDFCLKGMVAKPDKSGTD